MNSFLFYVIINIPFLVIYTLFIRNLISIKNMSYGVQDVSDSMNEIISGLGEMSSGTKKITTALMRLIEVTNDSLIIIKIEFFIFLN